MRDADLAAVEAIGEAVHPDYPEDAAVFAERLRLHPAGCLVLAAGAGVGGYVVSHPWITDPPALDTLLGALPDRPTTYYIHDLALLPAQRGTGAATAIVARLAAHAAALALAEMSLIAVGASLPFWQSHGFAAARGPAAKLASYAGVATYMTRRLATP
jgi:GNAT superfamily N-acetyltransferase